jgi:hypothetical protein
MSSIGRFMARAALVTAVALSALTAFQMSNAKATTFNWDFQGTFTSIVDGNSFIFQGETLSGSGTLTASYVSGSEYLVNSITGVINLNGNQSYPSLSGTLSGPLPSGSISFHSNDNELFYPSAQQFDASGLGFIASDSTVLDLFYGSCGGPTGYCLVTGGGHPGSLASLSFEASPTPLPSTWLMLFGGFIGLGFLAYRRTKKNAAALAAA